MRIDLVTLFPEFFEGPLTHSILKRAQREGRLKIHLHNPRAFTTDRYRTVDEKPFGGGAGMVLKPEPVFRCVESILGASAPRLQDGIKTGGFAASRLGAHAPRRQSGGHVILLSPRGKPLTQAVAARLARKKRLVLICGHYEGIDERVSEHLADEEISVGDFVTLGGEAPAVCLIESVVRLIPGVLGNPASLEHESFSRSRNGGLEKGLEFPQYTRPRNFRGWSVPKVLLSGDHAAIEKWRGEKSLSLTRQRRPDLIEKKRGKK